MKKEYTKPVIMFESFALSTSIAGDCETIISNMSKGSCGYEISRITTIFVSGIDDCNFTVPDDHPYEHGNNTFCYHVPKSEMTLFNS